MIKSLNQPGNSRKRVGLRRRQQGTQSSHRTTHDWQNRKQWLQLCHWCCEFIDKNQICPCTHTENEVAWQGKECQDAESINSGSVLCASANSTQFLACVPSTDDVQCLQKLKKHDVKSTHKNVCPLLRVLKFYLKCLQMRVLTRVLQQSMLTTDTHWDCPQLQVLAHRTQKWVATTEVNKFPSPSLIWSITQWTPSLSSKVFILHEAHFQKFWFAEEKTEHNFDPLFPLLMLFASTEVWSHNSALILFTKSCDLIFASIECQLLKQEILQLPFVSKEHFSKNWGMAGGILNANLLMFAFVTI